MKHLNYLLSSLSSALIFLLIAGCASQQIGSGGTSSKLLFPDGNYQQEVEVQVMAKGHQDQFDFNCVVQKKPESMLLLGYNSFGISLFKIKETGGKIEMESSIRRIQEKKDFFLKVFALVKTLFNVEKNDPRIQNGTLDVGFEDIKSQVFFQEMDASRIPLHLEIKTPELYQIEIRTVKYKLF